MEFCVHQTFFLRLSTGSGFFRRTLSAPTMSPKEKHVRPENDPSYTIRLSFHPLTANFSGKFTSERLLVADKWQNVTR